MNIQALMKQAQQMQAKMQKIEKRQFLCLRHKNTALLDDKQKSRRLQPTAFYAIFT